MKREATVLWSAAGRCRERQLEKEASIPEFVKGCSAVPRSRSGCSWRSREARGQNPWRFLLEPRYRGEREGAYLKEDAPPATVRDPIRGDCEDGSWQVIHWAVGEWCSQHGAASCKSVVPGNIRRCYCLGRKFGGR